MKLRKGASKAPTQLTVNNIRTFRKDSQLIRGKKRVFNKKNKSGGGKSRSESRSKRKKKRNRK